MGTVEDGLFDYDLGFGEQQLIPNSQVITSSSQIPRDFPKQTSLNSTTVEGFGVIVEGFGVIVEGFKMTVQGFGMTIQGSGFEDDD